MGSQGALTSLCEASQQALGAIEDSSMNSTQQAL
jgi:hypothetical protein